MQILRRLNPQWGIGIAFVLLTIAWITIHLPSTTRAFIDTDDAHQLAGALQILHGEHPFIDYEATYGPLTFYASALAQIIFGQRFIGEFVLMLVGYSAAYVFLALLIYRLTGKPGLVFLLGILALVAIPRLYKYYIMLGPVSTIWFAWRYLDKPKFSRMFWLALAVVITGLFRSDFGVYCAITATVTVVIQPSYKVGALKRAATLLTTVFLLALPYLLFLAFNGGLLNYFFDMVVGGPSIAAGMSMERPEYYPSQPLFSIANLTFMMLFFVYFPFFMAVFWVVRWKHIEEDQRKMLLPLITLYLFSLIQTYRFEYKHLLQSIPLSFPLLAWTINRLWGNIVLPKFRKTSILYLLIFCVVFAAPLLPIFLVSEGGLPPQVSSSIIISRRLGRYFLPEDQMALFAEARPSYIDVIKYIRRCTTDKQYLVGVPNFPNFYYFSGRSFGGGQIIFLPGYFSSEADQQRIISKMKQQDIPLLIYLHDFVFDNVPDRKFEVAMAMVDRYIKTNYHSIKNVEKFDLMLRNDLVIQDSGKLLVDFSCPVAAAGN